MNGARTEERRPWLKGGAPSNSDVTVAKTTALDAAEGRAPIVPLDGGPPRYLPIAGGGQCDRCGWRTFRRTQTRMWRHEDCEPQGYWILKRFHYASRYA